MLEDQARPSAHPADSLNAMPNDDVAQLVAEALRELVRFVDERTDSATADDDVRALETVAYTLNRVADEDRERLRDLLGPELAPLVGMD